MKYYDNGEPKNKNQIEEETWYPDYQRLMEIAVRTKIEDIKELCEYFLSDYLNTMRSMYSNPEQILRWSVLHVERNKNMKYSLMNKTGES